MRKKNNEYERENKKLKNEIIELKNEIKNLRNESGNQKSNEKKMVNVLFENQKSIMSKKINLVVSEQTKFSELFEKFLEKIHDEKEIIKDKYNYRFFFNGHFIEPDDNREIINAGLTNSSTVLFSHQRSKLPE